MYRVSPCQKRKSASPVRNVLKHHSMGSLVQQSKRWLSEPHSVAQCSDFIIAIIFNYALQHLRLILRSGLDVPTFATRRLHACHHTRAPSGGRWNCVREISGKFCLNIDLHFKFRDILHVVKLRHGTDGFTSPPKEGVLRIFSP